MNKPATCFTLLIIMTFGLVEGQHETVELRDPYKWPFSKKSIWNIPIGSNAVYVDAELPAVTEYCPQADEDVIILTPHEKPFPVFFSDAGWSERDRCYRTSSSLLLDIPIPEDFFANPLNSPNMAAAILGSDGTTVYQTQPYTRCSESDYATSMTIYPSVDLYGEGIEGAHGGSGLSSIGGTIRLGELVQGGRIRHALKCSVRGKYSLYFDKDTKGYRWPAMKADEHAESTYGTLGDPVMDCRMGALLAIPNWISIESMGLLTEPGKIVAQACKEYGMYIVDNVKSNDAYQICTEWSPDGRVEDEFYETWGYAFTQDDQTFDWWKDIELIFSNLHVVANNTTDNVGGGGEFLAPEAPDFYKSYKLNLEAEGAPGAELSPSGNIDVIHGQEIPIRVLFSPGGFRFSHWKVIDGEATIKYADSIKTTVVLVEGDASIVAQFDSISTGVLQLNDPEGSHDIVSFTYNPLTEKIRFTTAGEQHRFETIRIYNMQGQQMLVIHQRSIQESFLDLSSLQKGLYIISFQPKDSQFVSRKFLKY